jgi:hypothetical protein
MRTFENIIFDKVTIWICNAYDLHRSDIDWIPAFAGMTGMFLDDGLVQK